MKRSEINALVDAARSCFETNGWALPPEPRWDVTEFGLGDWRRHGLVLVNFAEEAEYCEKLMYAQAGMQTPAHSHRTKKEDIICRWGELQITLWPPNGNFAVKVNGLAQPISAQETIILRAGERITLEPGVVHAFEPISPEAIIGEVSTANDDLNDNFFVDPTVGRFPVVEEDEPATVKLVSDTR